MMKAIEITGIVDEQGQLRLDEPLSISASSKVRVIVLLPEKLNTDELEWLKSAAGSPSFDFLKDTTEDIYNLTDGKLFNHKG